MHGTLKFSFCRLKEYWTCGAYPAGCELFALYGLVMECCMPCHWSPSCCAKSRIENRKKRPGARQDRVRSHCNGTQYVVQQVSRRYIEAETVCCSSHCRLHLYSRIAVSGSVAIRKTAKHSFFCN